MFLYRTSYFDEVKDIKCKCQVYGDEKLIPSTIKKRVCGYGGGGGGGYGGGGGGGHGGGGGGGYGAPRFVYSYQSFFIQFCEGLPTGEAAVEVTEVVAAMVVVVVEEVDMVVVEVADMVVGPRLPAMESETPRARGRDRQRRLSCEHWRRRLERWRRKRRWGRGGRRAPHLGSQFIKASDLSAHSKALTALANEHVLFI